MLGKRIGKGRRWTVDNDQNSFWTPATAEQIAKQQGIVSPQSLDQLIGAAPELWATDDEFDQFLASVDRNRREHTSA